MAYFSSFWYKHYKDIGNCCMTAPLEVPPMLLKKMPKTPTSRTVLTYIDTGWMSEKKLKWIGWDVDGWITWIDPNGMMYRVRDLKRNEDGIEFEKNYEELKTQVNPEKPVYTSVLAYYTHEMNVQKTCGYCPDRSSVPSDDDDTDSSESTGGVTQQNVTAPPWQTFAGGGTPDYGGINTGYNPSVPSVNYGGYGDMYTEYTPPTANPGETVKTDNVTNTGAVTGDEGGKGIIKIQIDPLKPAGLKPLPESPVKTKPHEQFPTQPYKPKFDNENEKQKVARIDKLRVKPNLPPQNEPISFLTPSKPIKDIAKWLEQPNQNRATKPPAPTSTPKPAPKPDTSITKPKKQSNVINYSENADENSISQKSKKILEEIMTESGNPSILITSTQRSPEQQASAMLDNIMKKNGVETNLKLYANTGDRVVLLAKKLLEQGKSKDIIKKEMTELIKLLGPQKVSKHTANPEKINVIDISPKSLKNVNSFVKEAKKRGYVILYPPIDKYAVHIEISQ